MAWVDAWEASEVTAQQIVADHPDLASWIDAGDSWEKTQALGGSEMMVLRRTNSAVPGPKPILFVTSAIHAREYATAELEPFDIVIWFTGDSYGGPAGPGAAGEAALAGWLDDGGCRLMSAQDCYYDRGLTSFIQGHLGVASAGSDVSQTTVTGQGSVFGGLGPHTFDFPYSNFTDILNPDGTAELAFSGSVGNAAVDKDGGVYRTSYWGFGLEALPTAADREALLGTFLGWCDTLPQADPDGDTAPNATDCAPLDASAWALPGPATDLRVTTALESNLTRIAPAAPGASSVSFDVLRSPSGDGFSGASCVEAATAGLSATDLDTPAPGEVFHYLVRVRNACGGTLGTDSAGVPRRGAACF